MESVKIVHAAGLFELQGGEVHRTAFHQNMFGRFTYLLNLRRHGKRYGSIGAPAGHIVRVAAFGQSVFQQCVRLELGRIVTVGGLRCQK